MATDIENSLRQMAEKVARYVEDAAKLTVETRYVLISPDQGGDFSAAKPAALTEIHLDADSLNDVPAVVNERREVEVDNALYEIHKQNVAAAIEYRTKMLTALLDVFKSRLR